MIKIVTRGDDAGSSHSANAAIREACEKGVLKNISLLACGPAIEDAAKQLATLKGVALGFHVCLNSEWDFPRWGPVLGATQVPSLVDADHNFTQSPNKLHERGFKLDEALAETRAQLGKLRELGFKIIYMDEHMGVGWLKGFGEGLLELAKQEKLIFRPKLSELPKLLLEPKETLVEHTARRIRVASPGHYLIVGHPCYDDVETNAIRGATIKPGQIAREREGERRMFTDAPIMSLVREKVFLPIGYDEI